MTPGGSIDAAGDDDPDAEPPDFDAEVPDADTTPPDAMLDTFSGTITILEVSVLGVPTVGQGLQVAASFFQDGGIVPVFEETPGSILGCKVFEFTPAQAAAVGLDEGLLDVNIDNDAASTLVDPVTPDCRFIPTRGYLCPDNPICLSAPDTSCTGIVVTGVDDPTNADPTVCIPQLFAITDTDAPFTFSFTDGRYMSFANSGSALFPDGAAFPIVNKASNSTVVIGGHPAATATCPLAPIVLATAVHPTFGGSGPQPVCGTGNGCPDPGMISDNATITVNFTAGGDMDIPTFTNTVNPGNDFNLTAATTPTFAGIPQTGAAFTIGCDASTGCVAGSGDGVVLNIVTTDGSIAGLSPLSMPAPTTKRVQVRCSGLAATSVTVPAGAAAFLMQANSGATRIQATFIRGDLDGSTGPTHSVNVVSGHAITTFKTVTECNDGRDNGDVDTDVDFPADVGCTSASDTTED